MAISGLPGFDPFTCSGTDNSKDQSQKKGKERGETEPVRVADGFSVYGCDRVRFTVFGRRLGGFLIVRGHF